MKISQLIPLFFLLFLLATSSSAYGFESILRYLGMGYGPGYHAGGNCQPCIHPQQYSGTGASGVEVYHSHQNLHRVIQPTIESVHPIPHKSKPRVNESSVYPDRSASSSANRISFSQHRIQRLPPVND